MNENRTRIFSADVGGTKTLIRISILEDRKPHTVREALLDSGAFQSLGDLVKSFLSEDKQPIAAGCIAAAGPADGRSARVTNLGWRESAEWLERLSGIPHVQLVNDFFAVAAGIPHLSDEDTLTLNDQPRDPSGPVAIIGAGTGLGEAVSVAVEGGRQILSSEGGHASFAPRAQVQRQLLEFLETRYGHVSYERLLSGPGIVNIFTFFCEHVFKVSLALAGLDPGVAHQAAQVSMLAAEGQDIARRTMETFIDIYGAEAGNLALKVLPTGGVYVCGGIAAKNLHWFKDERFTAAFADKGRMRDVLLRFPIDVVSNQKLGLIGATAIAAEMVR